MIIDRIIHMVKAYGHMTTSEVVNLFRVLRDPEMNQHLRDACALTPYSRDEFCAAREATADPVERSRRMVVRACMGFGSAAGIGGSSGFRCDSKRKYATAAHLWERYPANLAAVCQRLQGVIIENKDALAVMRAHDAVTTLHYIDPPYVPETRVQGNRYYNHEMTVEVHEQLLAVARTIILARSWLSWIWLSNIPLSTSISGCRFFDIGIFLFVIWIMGEINNSRFSVSGNVTIMSFIAKQCLERFG